MILRALQLLGLACLFSLNAAGSAPAEDAAAAFPPLPITEQQLQDQLKTFDPAAVAAARHYYESPKIRDGILSMLSNLTPAIIANEEKAKGTTLSEADRAQIVAAITKGMSANFDFLLGLNMIVALPLKGSTGRTRQFLQFAHWPGHTCEDAAS